MKTIFDSSISRRYRYDDNIKLGISCDQDEFNIITKVFQKYKKTGQTNKYIIEDFIKEFLIMKMKEES